MWACDCSAHQAQTADCREHSSWRFRMGLMHTIGKLHKLHTQCSNGILSFSRVKGPKEHIFVWYRWIIHDTHTHWVLTDILQKVIEHVKLKCTFMWCQSCYLLTILLFSEGFSRLSWHECILRYRRDSIHLNVSAWDLGLPRCSLFPPWCCDVFFSFPSHWSLSDPDYYLPMRPYMPLMSYLSVLFCSAEGWRQTD